MGQTDEFFLRSEESLKYSKGLVIDTFTNFYCAPTVVICVINNYTLQVLFAVLLETKTLEFVNA